MSVEVALNEAKQRYEIAVDGKLAGFTVARDDGDSLAFIHTEIDENFEGQGLASKLVTAALDDVRKRDRKIVAHCPYVKKFISKHPEYADLQK